jgi:hypothetical protein
MTLSASDLHNQATELEAAGQWESALDRYRHAMRLAPKNPFLRYNAGNMLRRLQRFQAATEAYDQAIALEPGFAIARFMRATCLLQQGDLLEGFRELEWRKLCPTYDDRRYALPRQWAGEDLAGKTLFIYPELFQGDLLQFGRYALLAEMRGARVRLAAPQAMHALLGAMSPTIELLPADAAPQEEDLVSALMSLPAMFGTTLETVPHGVYLRPEPARLAQWRHRIGDGGLRVGVVWQGSPQATDRSFPLAAAAPIAAVPGVRLISLQKGGGLDQIDSLPPELRVELLGEDFDPGPDLFLDTAAALCACDLCVTADTSVAHLAGALGVRTWIALPWLADWRWMNDRRDTPWYPSARLFRQQTPGGWGGVFTEMAAALI